MIERVNIDGGSDLSLKTSEDVRLFEKLRETSRNKDNNESKKILNRLISNNPNLGILYAFLANIYWDNEDFETAENEFKNAIDKDPVNEKISVGYFHLLIELGRDDDAFNEARRFVGKGGTMRRYKEILNVGS